MPSPEQAQPCSCSAPCPGLCFSHPGLCRLACHPRRQPVCRETCTSPSSAVGDIAAWHRGLWWTPAIALVRELPFAPTHPEKPLMTSRLGGGGAVSLLSTPY